MKGILSKSPTSSFVFFKYENEYLLKSLPNFYYIIKCYWPISIKSTGTATYPLSTSVSLTIGKCRVELALNNLLHFSFSASYLLIAAGLELPFPDLSAASCSPVTMTVVNGMWVIHGMSAAFFERSLLACNLFPLYYALEHTYDRTSLVYPESWVRQQPRNTGKTRLERIWTSEWQQSNRILSPSDPIYTSAFTWEIYIYI